jgi:arsenate reductase
MVENPSVVKRPVLFDGKHYHVGFKADQYQHIFEK